MTLEEALIDAIEQLKSQNIDLTNIVKFGSEEINALKTSINKLENIINQSLDDEKLKEIKTSIEILKDKFQKDISFRVLATKKSNANDVFIRFLEKYNLKTEFIYDFIQMFH
jgi:ABC-type hemin transport system substrate-binding protein